ncbi:MAG: metalloregulator ArsR/SmtB family transcription factor [Verrucomicrobiota bacterium]|nr:metalloregulator ArsR/SmtB family transcription factor [Limisphaera sp.]MDW8380931.1 metalloregulator ArsR/SmtB family transcription factor [Verrucomicrobiota bacterium]
MKAPGSVNRHLQVAWHLIPGSGYVCRPISSGLRLRTGSEVLATKGREPGVEPWAERRVCMRGTLQILKALADPTRLRLLSLVHREELSVQELQEITRLGQSRISTHLGQLSAVNLVRARREGRRSFYRAVPQTDAETATLIKSALTGAEELPQAGDDRVNLERILQRRRDQAQTSFHHVAGRFGRVYGPGRSWQALGQFLLRIVPPLVVADLGSGEGLISELLARRCRKVIAVDNSRRMVAYGQARARRMGLKNLEFRLGDLQDPPLAEASVDVVLLSQALHHAEDPPRALLNGWRILKPGGQLWILDLLAHGFEPARELYGDRWLGFTEGQLQRWLEEAGFQQVEVSVVAREEVPPHFQTVLAGGVKPGPSRSRQRSIRRRAIGDDMNA